PLCAHAAPVAAVAVTASTAPELEPVVPDTTASPRDEAATALRHKPPVTSRAAENLFWLGRYTERAENACRLAQIILQCLGGEDQNAQPLLAWLSGMAASNLLVLDTVPPASQARRVFERALIANLADTTQAASVGYNLRALKNAAAAVRERLSLEQWHLIAKAETDFFHRCKAFTQADSRSAHASPPALDYSSAEALRALESAGSFLAAMTGAQTDRMTRDDGWRLLSIGRLTERLHTLSDALRQGFETRAVFEEGGFGALLALFDSTITYHAQYQQRRDVPALLDLLVLDRDNPRSLAWVVMTLRGRLDKLAGNAPLPLPDLAAAWPDPGTWTMADLWPGQGGDASGDLASSRAAQASRLMALLEQFSESALVLSDAIGRRYFSHAADASQSLGA
ncbi:alpha-E domain-containing protein, partial [Polaromonas sp.]|uniref:alpha-E domain-containing protein n=1 Tax=Polaromonas sp. TaxID=1869339 RepID=UPI002CFE9DB7